ncbi:MAG TPA: hypothetical protein VHP63_04675 [candidate division Zixibacteria bacterium]|nr:hypothetical protein [candidate division Zixibacteria bacterium]
MLWQTDINREVILSKKDKNKQSSGQSRKPVRSWEDSSWYVPIMFGIMLLALVILFGVFLFSDGKMLYGTDMLTAGVYHRSMLVDHFKEFHEIPQWDPHVFGGMPYVDAFHGDIFYPLAVLKFILPLYFHLGFNLFLHIFLAGIFMYLAARQFKLGKTASLFSAAGYMFAPYLVSLVSPGHEGKIYVTALFPLVMLFLDRGFEKKPFLNFTILGLVLGIIIVSPHPQMSYFTLWAAGLFTVFKLIVLWREKKSVLPLIRPATLAAYAVVLALLFSAIQFYPGYYYTTHYSPRADTKSGWEWAISWSLHEEEAFSQIIPEFSGAFDRTDKSFYWGKNAFKDNSESVGVSLLFLSWIGLFFTRRKEAWFFGGLALFAFLYALGDTTPLFRLFYELIPKVKSLRAPSMIMFIFLFSVALLAGMGVQKIIDWRNSTDPNLRKKLNYLLLGFPAFLFLTAFLFTAAGPKMLSLWSSFFYSEAATTVIQRGVTKFDLGIRNLPAIQSGAWFAFIFIVIAAFLVWRQLAASGTVVMMSFLMLVPVVDGVRFDERFIGVSDPHRFLDPTTLTQQLSMEPGKFRTLNLTGAILPKSLLPQHGIDDVTGYHGNQLRWYDDLLGGPDLKNWTNPRFLNLVGARYILIPTDATFPEDYFGPERVYSEINFGNLNVVVNRNAFERAYLVNQYEVIPNRQDIYPKVLTGTEDLKTKVYLEEEPELPISAEPFANDSAAIVHYEQDSIEVIVNCTSNRLLIFTDNFYDSWHAIIDGKPAKTGRAYGSFRAVAIPAGAQKVVFKYESERYATGKMISFATSLYILLALGFCLVADRMKKKNPEISQQPS